MVDFEIHPIMKGLLFSMLRVFVMLLLAIQLAVFISRYGLPGITELKLTLGAVLAVSLLALIFCFKNREHRYEFFLVSAVAFNVLFLLSRFLYMEYYYTHIELMHNIHFGIAACIFLPTDFFLARSRNRSEE